MKPYPSLFNDRKDEMNEQDEAILRLALAAGWTYTAVLLFDDEAVDGIRWNGPNREEIFAIGDYGVPTEFYPMFVAQVNFADEVRKQEKAKFALFLDTLMRGEVVMATSEIERLVAFAETNGIKEADLDMLVHECAQEVEIDTLNSLEDEEEQEAHICDVERRASNINNGGLEYQLDFLLEHDGYDEVMRALSQLKEEK